MAPCISCQHLGCHLGSSFGPAALKGGRPKLGLGLKGLVVAVLCVVGSSLIEHQFLAVIECDCGSVVM